MLSKLDPNMGIWIARDPEGNGFSKFEEIGISVKGDIDENEYRSDDFWDEDDIMSDILSDSEYKEFPFKSVEEAEKYIKENTVVVLWPC